MDVSVDLSPASTNPQGFRLGELAVLLRRRAWLIALCAVCGAVAAVALSTLLPRLYTASSKITIAGESFAIPELQGVLRSDKSDPMLFARTELQALSSRQLLQQVAGELDLAALPEFNAALRQPSLASVVTGRIKGALSASPVPSAPVSQEDGVVATASRSLAVFNDNRSLVIDLSFTSQDPKLSADFVNTLVRDYISGQAGQRSTANQDANGALLKRIDGLNAEIAALEQQSRDIRDKSQIVGLRAGSVGQQQLEELASAVTRASLERAQLESTWQRATALARNGTSDELAGVLSSETVSRLREQEAAAARQVAQLSTRYGSSYPGVRDAQASLDSSRRLLSQEVQRIIGSLTTQLQVAREHERDAQTQLAAARDDAVKNGNVQARLDDLRQQITDRRALAQNLLERTQQTITRPASEQTPDVRVLSEAFPPAAPSSPKTGLAGMFGLLAGAVLGSLVAVGTARDRNVATTRDVARSDGLPILSVLPASLGGDRQVQARRVFADPSGPDAEALRTLRARIRLHGRAAAPRVLAFIPAQRGETGSALAVAFARLAAMDGERVLLIEGNLRAPGLPRALGATGGELPAVLTGTLGWREAVLRDADSPLDLLFTDRPASDSHALLGGIRLQNLLVEARDDYTLIVVSAPSAATPSDALVLAHRVDTSIVVFASRKARPAVATTRPFIEDLLKTSTGPVAAVLVSA
jgi:succinoglycan biosynthesis transport protein ExoP